MTQHETSALADAQIIGALATSRSKTPFSRAPLILRAGSAYLQVHSYLESAEAQGSRFDAEALAGLEATEQVLRVEPALAARSGALAWVLRPQLPRRAEMGEALRAEGVLLAPWVTSNEGVWLAVVDEPRAYRLLERWQQSCFDEAGRMASDERWEEALVEARSAFGMALDLSARGLALLAYLYERSGCSQRAAGYLEVARSSRGPDFVKQVQAERATIAARLSAPTKATAPNDIAAALEGEPSAPLLGHEERLESPLAGE